MAYLTAKPVVTCPFRYVSSRKPSPWAAGYHPGIDFKAFLLTPIYAPADAKIIHSGTGGWGGAYGRHVIGESKGTDGKTYRWIAAHLTTAKPKVGARIKAGERIGLSGATGNTFGPHLHFEVREAPYGYYDHVNPNVILNVKAAKPAAPIVPWFDGIGWNLAASNAEYGKASWDKRVALIIKAIKHYDRDVLLFAEAETQGRQGEVFEAALSKAGYKVAVGDNQRMIAVRKTIKVGRTKVVTLAEKGPEKDDKQIVLAECWPSGPNAVVLEAGHFEYRDGAAFDKVRIKQGKQARAATVAFAKACNVPTSRIVSYNDENSASAVSDQAYAPTFVDLADRDTYVSPNTSTLITWSGATKSNGYRPDKVHVAASRPARGGTSVTFAGDKVSDHLPVIFTIGKS